MTHRMKFSLGLTLLGCVLLSAIPVARADDWLVSRHDVRRTAASSGQLGIAIPATRWRSYLGGRLGAAAFLAYDVDADSRDEVVFVVGGRVLAKEAETDVVDWESPILPGANKLFGPVDLDEDGRPEVLVFRSGIPSDVWVVSLVDGSVLWHLPGHVIYQFRWPRVGDLDGDGHLDVYLGTGPCGNVPPGWGDPPPGLAYTFCDASGCGFDGARELWRLENAGGSNCGDGAQIADVDGDGMAELVASWGHTEVGVYDGATGALEGTLDSAERYFNRANTAIVLADVVGDTTPELFAITRAALSGLGSQSFVVYRGDATGYTRLWQVAASNPLSDLLIFDDLHSVADLDGDGTKEVVYGLVDGSTGIPTVFVRGAADGAERVSLAGFEFAGVVDLDGDGRREIVTRTATGVAVLGFDGATLATRFTLPDVVPVERMDLEAALGQRPTPELAVRNLDGDPSLEMIAGVEDAGGGLVGLRVFDIVGDTPTEVGRFDAPENVQVVALAFAGPITSDAPELLVSTSDGFVLVLDGTLAVKNRYEGFEFSLPGMRAGGYLLGVGGPAQAPLVVSSAGAQGVYVTDSRGVFSRLDVRGADAARPPSSVYSIVGLEGPALADVTGDGTLELLGVEDSTSLVARSASDGVELWRQPGATTRWGVRSTSAGQLLGGPIPVAAGPGRVGILLERFEPDPTADFLRVRAFAGDTGAPGVTSDRFRLMWGANNYGLAAAADVNGDGFDDYVSSPATPLRLAGSTLATAGVSAGAGVNRADPLIADLDGDGDLDVFAHGSWFASRAVDLGSMSALADGEARVNVGQYGALVSCMGGAAVASGSALPGEIYVERLSAGAIASLAHRLLVGGQSYALADAPTDAAPGRLSNVTAVAGLLGASDPAILVGSRDGYLYALDPCDLTLRWALDLRFPVGDPIVGDADGDGQDDLIVSVADGFLYGIRGAAYPAPDPVLDLDPASPGATDLDEVDSPSSLMASWPAIAGAASYEVAVLTPGGTALTRPAFQDVGDVTRIALRDLPLRLGGRYLFAVRALGPSGASGEATSDGVVVADLLGPEASISGPFMVFVDGPPESFTLTARDHWSLGAYVVEVRDGADALVFSLGEGSFSGTSDSFSASWGGGTNDGSVASEGSYRVVARVQDGAGHETSVEWMTQLTQRPVDVIEGGVSPDAGADGGLEGSGGGGCGCVVAGAERRRLPWPLLALIGLAIGRRRLRG